MPGDSMPRLPASELRQQAIAAELRRRNPSLYPNTEAGGHQAMEDAAEIMDTEAQIVEAVQVDRDDTVDIILDIAVDAGGFSSTAGLTPDQITVAKATLLSLADALKRRPPSALSARAAIRAEHAAWSDATFGPPPAIGPVGPLKHLAKEALEAAAAPQALDEWADMQFLLWDAQRRAGITDDQVVAALREKLAVNKARHWPAPQDGEPREHVSAAAITPLTPIMIVAPSIAALQDEGYEVCLVYEDLEVEDDGAAEFAAWEPDRPQGEGWLLHYKGWIGEEGDTGAIWARPLKPAGGV
ncbi:dATP/dGTP pyrophosphohydrolase domain-containing protein [Pseudoroseomonas cervicalis]|uniref:dATP/dGTP pyrophosphohydrolase domain-containing protein n=1 Tax=Teichococcus cervicalis TaxID=204525 RepID=UPI0022F14687|nr:dATP/dGTP pyrophosphohydrolase domain-containing protein [Pseudoroseomonas cervicalis]WBV42760.1 DUF550 domain-containing protein [Pseudoroseomonas cervicalis]